MAEVTVDDDTSSGDEVTIDSSKLSEAEWKAVEEFVTIVESESVFDEGYPVDENTAIKFLMARKFEVQPAVNTYRNNQVTCKRFNLRDLKPKEDPLHQELVSGKFTVLNGKDSSGAVVCLFTARLHQPKLVAHSTVLKSLVFQLDEVMRSLEAQRNGLALIYDMTGAGYGNFDFDLSMKVLSLLKGGYPARLKHVYILSAPLWFRASLVILSSFLKEKIRDRVELVKGGSDLLLYIPKETLPTYLGGTADANHKAWLTHCMESFDRNQDKTSSTTVAPESTCSKGKPPKEIESTEPPIANDISTPPTETVTPTLTTANEPTTSKDHDSQAHEEVVANNIETNENLVDSEKEKSNDTDSPNRDITEARPNGFSEDLTTDTSKSETVNGIQDRDEDSEPEIDEEAEVEETTCPFTEFIDHMRSIKRVGIYEEYKELRMMPPLGAFEATRHPINLKKNRYSDVLCYEHSRVKLPKQNDDEFSDYINANYVDGYRQPRAYICTQGPMSNTYVDFWRMIWEENVLVVVMITRCVERGRVKCGQYWPENTASCNYGFLEVTHLDTTTTSDYTVRHFEIKHMEEEKTRVITHFQFTSWPDFGVLSSAEAFHDVLSQVHLAQEAGLQRMIESLEPDVEESSNSNGAVMPMEPPIVVHCSAGIGRTGTFCCTDINVRRMADGGKVDIFNTVRRLREQRAFSVQTPAQYEFCHLAVVSHMVTLRQEAGLETEDLEQFLREWDSQRPVGGK